ncbi:MAG: hypothetical protein BGO89_06145 [Candidatus Kapaibacterium thiocyanatum]|uniref:RHS repeat-associated core domain-containing protein n=1 Tax=Candidatus Kapaibacterium thiocyanatum TaxID=1895771 RepID=A0A1M3KZI4_9BACT|nr:MAG: hypothetical protein BGO89_06145 ['Candidatus Kapabacteria' thiocyanatum]
MSVDPLAGDYPWYTPYQFAGNTPIQAIDLDGLEEFIVTQRSFAPWYRFGSAPLLGPERMGYSFYGDNRGFSLSKDVSKKSDYSGVTSRIYQAVKVNMGDGSIVYSRQGAGESVGDKFFVPGLEARDYANVSAR